jgi:hypothetical protein
MNVMANDRFSMERFFKRKASKHDHVNNSRCLPEINFEEEIKYDLGLRKEIDAYHPNQREKVRRKYLENGPCQPRTCIFPFLERRFIPEWFDEFDSWLEYSESKDRAYCFCFVVSCLERRRMQDTKHLLLMVGMVIIGKRG